MLFVPDELLEGSVDMLGMEESCGDLIRQQLKDIFIQSQDKTRPTRNHCA